MTRNHGSKSTAAKTPPPGFLPRLEIRRIFDLTDGRLDGLVRQRLSVDDELKLGRKSYFRAQAVHRILVDNARAEERQAAAAVAKKAKPPVNYLEKRRRLEYLERLGVVVHVESIKPLLSASADAIRAAGDKLGRRHSIRGRDAQAIVNAAIQKVHEAAEKMSKREAEAMANLGLVEG